MFSDQMVQDPFHAIVLPLTLRHPEILWFADKNVKVTEETASQDPKDLNDSWTHRLAQEQNPLGQPLVSLPNGGGRYIELERTLSSVVYFHWFLEGSQAAYDKLTSVQNPAEKLSWESFQDIHQLAQQVASIKQFEEAIEGMLIFGHAGKTPRATALAESQGVRQADHDDFITTIFNRRIDQIAVIFPSFALLSPKMQQWLIQLSQSTPIHWGHAYHLEGGERLYANFEQAIQAGKVTPALLDVGYLMHLCDTAAAQSHLNSRGSLALTEPTYQGYRLIRETLGKMLSQGLSAKEALQDNFAAKARLVKANISDSPVNAFLVRLTGWLRLHTPEDFQRLRRAAQKIPQKDLQLAIEQFDMKGGFNVWQRNPTYGTTVLLNLANFQNTAEGRQLKMDRAVAGACCLARWTAHYAAKVQYANDPVNFNQMAGVAANHPELFQLQQFDPLEFEPDDKNNVVFKGKKREAKLPSALPEKENHLSGYRSFVLVLR